MTSPQLHNIHEQASDGIARIGAALDAKDAEIRRLREVEIAAKEVSRICAGAFINSAEPDNLQAAFAALDASLAVK